MAEYPSWLDYGNPPNAVDSDYWETHKMVPESTAPPSFCLAWSDGTGIQLKKLENQWGHEWSHCGSYPGAGEEERQPPSPSLDDSAEFDSQLDEISSSSGSSSTYSSLGDESPNEKRKRLHFTSSPDASAAKRHKGDDSAESSEALTAHDQHQNQDGTLPPSFFFHAASFAFSFNVSHNFHHKPLYTHI
jgi:hypothetical protein